METQQLNSAQEDALLHETVRAMMAKSKPLQGERREWKRVPYFCTAMISLDDYLIRIPAYVHDISEKGIGFIHGTPFEPGEVTASLLISQDECVKLRVEMLWCSGFGSGWYRSGGRLLAVVQDDADLATL